MGDTAPLLPESARKSGPRHAGHASRPGHVSLWRVGIVFGLLVTPLILLADVELPDIPWFGPSPTNQNMCPQTKRLHPQAKVAGKVLNAIESPEFETRAVGALSGAVKIA